MIIICNKPDQNLLNKIKQAGKNVEIINNNDQVIITCDDDIILFDILKANEKIQYLALDNSNIPQVKTHQGKIKIKQNTFKSNQDFMLICGPCSIESSKQFNDNLAIINQFKEVSGIRCGAYKPRTSPYGFQGLHQEAINIINQDTKDKLLVGEITSIEQLANCPFDIIQIGTRNMQNYELLKAVSKCDKPIILKRGMGATIDEWLNSAEYLLVNNPNVILCERGIRTFENSTRTTLDLSAIPVIKSKTNLPIIIDPSHAAGKREYIEALCYGAIACGADGLLIETSCDPYNALSDGRQSIDYPTLNKIITKTKQLLPMFKRSFYEG